jgi:hypothetical protein
VGKLGGTCCAISDGFQRGEADALWRGRAVEARRCAEGERREIQRERILIGAISYLDCGPLCAARRAVVAGAAAGRWGGVRRRPSLQGRGVGLHPIFQSSPFLFFNRSDALITKRPSNTRPRQALILDDDGRRVELHMNAYITLTPPPIPHISGRFERPPSSRPASAPTGANLHLQRKESISSSSSSKIISSTWCRCKITLCVCAKQSIHENLN